MTILDQTVEALMTGRLEDALRAGRKAARKRPDLPETHMLLAEVQRVLGDASRAQEAMARALRLRPAWTQARFALALAELYRDFGRLADAEERCRAALALEPGLADARFNLAGLLHGTGRTAEAIAELEGLLVLEPRAADARQQLVHLLYEQRSIERLESVCREGMALHPGAYLFAEKFGAALWYSGRHAEALRAFESALERAATDQERQDASLTAANAQLALGRYEQGWRFYHARHTRSRVAAQHPDVVADPAKLAQLARPARILIRTEQGLGDEIFFLRFAAALRSRGHRLSVAGEPKLDALLATMPELFEPAGGSFDFAICSGDLPLASGVSFALPLRLPVDGERRARMRAVLERFGPPPYLGVTWRGGPLPGEPVPQRGTFLQKVIAPQELGRGLASVDARVVILQRKALREDVERFIEGLGRPALDLGASNDDLREALAVLSLLDDYVGSSNTNFHLRAGLAGMPAKVMVTKPTNWRWGIRGASSAWFPAFQVYRRELWEDWSVVLTDLRRDLADPNAAPPVTGGDSREARVGEYEFRLGALSGTGHRPTTASVFREYVAQLCEPDPDFDELYLEGCFATGTDVRPLRRRDRFRLLLQQLERTLALEGRIAECGCFRGLSSYLLCSRVRRQDPGFDGTGYEIYDSFEGLSEPAIEDLGAPDPRVVAANRRGQFAHSLADVQRSLSAFAGITYGPGWIPSAFRQDGTRYRFVHVDVDLYQPTKASLEYFWPRLVQGGVMVCDDYNWPGAKRAADEFAANTGAMFTLTASNQAVFNKS